MAGFLAVLGCRISCRLPGLRLIALAPIPRAESSEAAQLAEVYAKLEEIEADKAPARYLKFPSFL